MDALDEISINVAEVIPYYSFREKIIIVAEEILKNRYVEIWDKFIYSAEKWKEN